MRLMFLYGPPGVGKLTVGGELAALTGFRLFHNHLTIDLVSSIFPPDTAAWDRLAYRIRVDALAEAAREGVDLIYTRAPRAVDPAEVHRVRAIVEPVQAAGGTVMFVQLTCDKGELLLRVQGDDRRARNKLTEPDVLLEMYDLYPALPFDPHMQLDTTGMLPAEAAVRIREHFALPVALTIQASGP